MKILLLAKNKEWADCWVYEHKLPKKSVHYISQPKYAHGLNNLPYIVSSYGPYHTEIIRILGWGKCYEITTDQAKELVNEQSYS